MKKKSFIVFFFNLTQKLMYLFELGIFSTFSFCVSKELLLWNKKKLCHFSSEMSHQKFLTGLGKKIETETDTDQLTKMPSKTISTD